MSDAGMPLDLLWFLGVVAALLILFAVGLRFRLPLAGAPRWLYRSVIVGLAVVAVLFANMALFRHDAHLDLTREKAFTPSTESLSMIRGLTQDVELVYFYQKQSPGGRAAKTMVEIMGRMSPHLKVTTIDPDQNPAAANSFGVRIYNTALLLSGGKRLEIPTIDDRDIAIGIVRITRGSHKTICFLTDHGEYDINNFEFHTHFEGSHSHSHDIQGMAVVQMEDHGLGRLRRALEKLGLAARPVSILASGQVPPDCSALVEANPRTRHTPKEAETLAAYLAAGGSLLMLVEPDIEIEPKLAEVLARAGIRIEDGVVVDPVEHYYTDDQMIAVTRYGRHPATAGLALSFFPGVRPLATVPAEGIEASVLFSSSAQSYVMATRRPVAPEAAPTERRAVPIAVAAEGRYGGDATKPFRAVVVGDADFASNSFFPYMSNADLVLAALAWLIHEEKAPTLTPPVEVLPTVTLTNHDVRTIFIATVIALPGAVALAGAGVWWRRRR
jgi:hypothetical protein